MSESNSPERFEDTQWSLVSMARRDSDKGREALGELCGNYWYPLYAFLRQQGRGKEDAEDLIQDFFGRLVAGRLLSTVDPNRGRFRSYLLSSLQNLARDSFKSQQRIKRGGLVLFLSLEAEQAEDRWLEDRQNVNSPEAAFDRAWAATVLGRAGSSLGEEFRKAGKSDLFEALWPRVTGTGGLANEEIGRNLGMTPGAVSVALGRLRARYADAIRAEIMRSVGPSGDPDEEIQELMAALAI